MINISTVQRKLQALNTASETHHVEIHISGDGIEYIATCSSPSNGDETDAFSTGEELNEWLKPITGES